MKLLDEFAEKSRFRIIDQDDHKFSRFIKFHKTNDVIIQDKLIYTLRSGTFTIRYIIEGECLELW